MRFVDNHRLLCEDFAARFQARANMAEMQMVWTTNQQKIQILTVEHRFDIVVCRRLVGAELSQVAQSHWGRIRVGATAKTFIVSQ